MAFGVFGGFDRLSGLTDEEAAALAQQQMENQRNAELNSLSESLAAARANRGISLGSLGPIGTQKNSFNSPFGAIPNANALGVVNGAAVNAPNKLDDLEAVQERGFAEASVPAGPRSRAEIEQALAELEALSQAAEAADKARAEAVAGLNDRANLEAALNSIGSVPSALGTVDALSTVGPVGFDAAIGMANTEAAMAEAEANNVAALEALAEVNAQVEADAAARAAAAQAAISAPVAGLPTIESALASYEAAQRAAEEEAAQAAQAAALANAVSSISMAPSTPSVEAHAAVAKAGLNPNTYAGVIAQAAYTQVVEETLDLEAAAAAAEAVAAQVAQGQNMDRAAAVSAGRAVAEANYSNSYAADMEALGASAAETQPGFDNTMNSTAGSFGAGYDDTMDATAGSFGAGYDDTMNSTAGSSVGLQGLNAITGFNTPAAPVGLQGLNAITGLNTPAPSVGLQGLNSMMGLSPPSAPQISAPEQVAPAPSFVSEPEPVAPDVTPAAPGPTVGLQGLNSMMGLNTPAPSVGLQGLNSMMGLNTAAPSVAPDAPSPNPSRGKSAITSMMDVEAALGQQQAQQAVEAAQQERAAINSMMDLEAAVGQQQAKGQRADILGSLSLDAPTTSRSSSSRGRSSGRSSSGRSSRGAARSTATRSVATWGPEGQVSFSEESADSSDPSGKGVVCSAMNRTYGFGSFRNKLWIEQSKNLDPAYERGYHAIALPLIAFAYAGKSFPRRAVKAFLEHAARRRTADIWKQKRGRRDWIGACERAIIEPICYLVGKMLGPKRGK